jgi:hypothetical protein
MIRKHTPGTAVVCFTDEKILDPGDTVHWRPIPAIARHLMHLKSPEGDRFPSCYVRLWLFSQEAHRALGVRKVLLLDVDLVVRKSLAPLFDPEDDFVGWLPIRDWGSKIRVGGGIYLLRLGTRTGVWDDFIKDPTDAIRRARLAGYRGSDQAWLSYKLAANCMIYPPSAGIYSIRDLPSHNLIPPRDARLVQMNGPNKPWQSALPWVRAEWR